MLLLIHNVRKYEGIRMVGRNEKCPCGSGKKFKVCCINSLIEFPTTPNFTTENIPGEFFNSADPKFDQIKQDLREIYYLEKKNADFLSGISMELGLLGCPTDGILYAKRALKYCPTKNSYLKYGILTNLAAMHAEINEHKKGLEYLKLVPDGFSRKTIIEANVRREIEPWEKVIGLYEKAIAEEPNFFLPYEHIISRLNFDDPKREYLISEAYRNMPANPRVAIFWASKELWECNYETLADVSWIEKVRKFDLDNSVENTVVNFREKLPSLLGSLELIHEISKTMFSAIENTSLKNSFKSMETRKASFFDTNVGYLAETYLPTTEQQFKCYVAQKLMDVSITIAWEHLLNFSLKHLCDECKKDLNLEELLFECSYRNIKNHRITENSLEHKEVESALRLAEKIIDQSEELSDKFINSLFDLLDDEVSSDIVLDYAKRIFDEPEKKIKYTDPYEELRLFWNLAIVAGKSSYWTLSELFFEKVRKLDLNSLIQSLKFEGKIIRSGMSQDSIEVIESNVKLLPLYVAVTQLAQKKIKEAKNNLEEFDYELNVFAQSAENVSALILWVEENQSSKVFRNEFRHSLRKFGLDFWVGEKPKYIAPSGNLSDVISLVNKNSISAEIKFHENLMHHSIVDSEDLSEIVNSLEAVIPQFRVLPNNAINSLMTAETYRLNKKTRFDTAPSIMGFCKALEIHLKQNVFGGFCSELKASENFESILEQALADQKVNQFRAMITFIKSGFLELGSAAQSLRLCTGKTSKRVELLSQFKSYLHHYYDDLLETENIIKIEQLSKQYRNPAVHEQSFNSSDLENVRNGVSSLLNSTLRLRSLVGD